jgi:hypothetical protein
LLPHISASHLRLLLWDKSVAAFISWLSVLRPARVFYARGSCVQSDAEVFRPFYPFSSTVERTLRRPSVLAQGVASHGASTPQRGCLHNAFSVWCSVLPLFPSPNLILAVLFYAMLWTNYYREMSI